MEPTLCPDGKSQKDHIPARAGFCVTNGLLWARDFEANRRAIMAARLLVLEGVIQRSEEGVIHLMANRAFDRTNELSRLSADHLPVLDTAAGDGYDGWARHAAAKSQDPRGGQSRSGHPRDVRVLPPSRDFH